MRYKSLKFPAIIDTTKHKQMKTFSNKILNSLKRIPDDDRNKLNPLYYFESRSTINELTQLLNGLTQSEEEITSDEQLKPFYDFLKKRREYFIPDRTHPKTKADRACECLVYELFKEANSRSYQPRDPADFLKPTPRDFTGIQPEVHLKHMLLADVTNRDKLITTLLILDRSDWIAYCNNIELTKLIELASHGKTTVDDVLDVVDKNADEDYQRASSFCKTYVYLKDREKGPQFKSYTGALLDLLKLKKVPNLADKTKGTFALLEFLMDKADLMSFNLDDPAFILYPYRHVLNDGKLKKIVEELKEFISLHVEHDNVSFPTLSMQQLP